MTTKSCLVTAKLQSLPALRKDLGAIYTDVFVYVRTEQLYQIPSERLSVFRTTGRWDLLTLLPYSSLYY